MRRPLSTAVVVVVVGLALALTGCVGCGPLADGLPEGDLCSSCHGGVDNAAPPRALVAGKTTQDLEVGRHQLHLAGGFARKQLQCDDCHLVPVKVEDEGHIDLASPEQPSDPADVTFGALASLGVTPAWNRGEATCSNSYCHGATLHGGTRTAPTWTFAEEPAYLSQRSLETCNGCHGAPPPLPHPVRTDCEHCHPTTVGADLDVVPGGTHLDGKLDVRTGCDVCHGNDVNPAPPGDLSGHTSPLERGVGAHQQHLLDSAIRKAVACAECHLVPSAADDPGHLDSPLPAELTFGPLATGGVVSPAWNGQSCTTYCHGATLHGGTATAPEWTRVDGTQAQCGSCHGAPPPAPHPPSSACSSCHPLTVFPDGGIDLDGGHHLDGVLDLSTACDTCHGSALNPAPPMDTLGQAATTERGVGAHQAHLRSSTWRREILCDACHLVPASVSSPGHLDSALPAELTWGPLALAQSAQPTWDGVTCSGAYCHGARTRGGTLKTPTWTQVDGTQAACGTCHGVPPPNHYGAACHLCHPTMDANEQISDPTRHIDGVVDVNGGGACGACHPIPPATGAHAAHYGDQSNPPLATYGDTRQASDYFDGGQPPYLFGCGNCHPLDLAQHLNGTVDVELFNTAADAGTLKAKNGPSAAYDRSTGQCTNGYCHSSGQQVPVSAPSPGWRSGTSARCDSCHGNPPAYPSGGAGTPTANVHLVLADDGFEFGHFGGLPGPWHTSFHGGARGPGTGAGAITCQTCHAETTHPQDTGPSGFYWLNTTGTYQLDGGALGFSCTPCHTGSTGPAPLGSGRVRPLKHVNGSRDVSFDLRATLPPGYTGGVSPAPTTPYWVVLSSGLKENTLVGAAYDSSTKTCTNVSCHRQQTSVQWGVTPVGWATCDDCHQY